MTFDEKLKMETKEKFSKAADLYKQGNLNEALKLLEELAVSNPSSAKIIATLANTYWDLEMADEAFENFQKAVELAPEWEDASLGLFHCLWEHDKKDEALREAKRYMSVSNSKDYEDIIKEINEKM